MNAIDMLLKLKHKSLKAIQLAAETGDSQRIIDETARLSEIEMLITRQEVLTKQVEILSSRDPRETLPISIVEKEKVVSSSTNTSPRELGEINRREFVKDCANKGIRLVPKKGVLYENSRREVVGIAFATERKEDAWFLGLPSNEFAHAVLICKTEAGSTFHVCLPKAFIQKHLSALSESKGQIKFNVRRQGMHYLLRVPNIGLVQIDEYIDRPDNID